MSVAKQELQPGSGLQSGSVVRPHAGQRESTDVIIVKKFYSAEDQRNHRIKATPTFTAYRMTPQGRELIEYLPGLLEAELMKKRLRDIVGGRARLDRFRSEQQREDEALAKVLEDWQQLADLTKALPPAWIAGEISTFLRWRSTGSSRTAAWWETWLASWRPFSIAGSPTCRSPPRSWRRSTAPSAARPV